MPWVFGISFFVLGLIIGSFINVIIYRTPRKMSIIKPRSRCLNCETEIKWYDNIPIISYLILKGKCRNCQQKISFRYPLVEGLLGLLYLGSYLRFGISVEIIFAIIFLTVSVIVVFIDIDFQIIPNLCVGVILLLGIGNTIYLYFSEGKIAIEGYLIGFIVGFGILFLIRLLGFLLFKKEAMGWGDVKLMTATGLFLGVGNIILTILFSSIVGAIVELILLKIGKREKKQGIPFGPYLVLGMIISLFFGSYIINWYLGLLG